MKHGEIIRRRIGGDEDDMAGMQEGALRNFQSFRFLAMFAVAVFLFAVNPFLLSTEYGEKLEEYNRRVEQQKKSDKTWVTAFRRPNPLSFVAEGGDRDAIELFRIHLELGIMPEGVDQYGVNVTFPSFQTIDWVFILKVLLSLLAILLTFDAVSGEKERGTLSLMYSNSLSRASIIMGKYLGALITVIVPTAVGMLVSMIIISLRGNTTLDAESVSRLALVAVMAFAYVSLFVLLGIVISSVVHRSSVSLLLSLSVWIFLVIVIPNLAGIIAESTLEVVPEHEFAKRESETYRKAFGEWRESVRTRGPRTQEELGEELAGFLNDLRDELMRLMDSYVNTIYEKEDLALNISRISPASAFELAGAEIVDADVLSQRRFYRAARKYYDLCEGYYREKTGMVAKYSRFMDFPVKIEGKTVMVKPTQPKPLPEDTSDFPAMPKVRLTVSESVVSGLWSIILLAIWNVVLLLLSHLAFLRYDVRQ